MKSNNIRKTLLIIDDDVLQCDVLSLHLGKKGLEVLAANTGTEGIGVCSKRIVDIVLLDQKLPDGKGVDLCEAILRYNEQTKIIFITAYPSLKNAISAIKAGAYDYLSKPFELEELDVAVDRALATLSLERLELIQNYRSEKEKEDTILIGGSKDGGLSEVRRMAEMAAAAEAPVLLTGETGVGKNVVARTIHYMSTAREDAFISINCGAIPENLIEAELFGFEKGAFTGAVAVKKGLFEMADGGTLFLDEIGTLPLHLQSKLLGVLDEKKLRRLGGKSDKSIHVRIIAATNMDIESAVEEGGFREDLYYRINVVRIHIPPLRERLQDIPDLCRFFVSRLITDSHLNIPDFELERLMEYRWPGNVRELVNIIERSIILRKGNNLRPSDLLGKDSPNVSSPACERSKSKAILSLKELEKTHIQQTLDILSGNHTRAAMALGVSRSTLKRKIKSYRIF